jgi:TolB-like protein/DNA-binding winged helix-turn-helix (wHTH) protein
MKAQVEHKAALLLLYEICCIMFGTNPEVTVATSASVPAKLRFGVYEFDPGSGELSKSGVGIKLRPQAAKVLALLASRPGELITRDELRREIWGEVTYVEFDQGLNACIRDIRGALVDQAETPRYIQTVPRQGYRFVAPVRGIAIGHAILPQSPPRKSPWPLFVALPAVMIVTVAFVVWKTWPAPLSVSPPVLAVLPFANLSPEPDSEYFSDGLTEELIYTLGRIDGLQVVSHTSSFALKGKHLDLNQVAARLRATVVLEGSVRKSGGRIRVTAQLIEIAGERKLWSQTYDREGKDFLSIQEDIAGVLSSHLSARFIETARCQTNHHQPRGPGRLLDGAILPSEALTRASSSSKRVF